VVGKCEHEQEAWLLVPCKRRGCPECGPRGRRRIAEKIAYGVRKKWPCAWLVLTFKRGEVGDHSTAETRRRFAAFIRWLRSVNPGLEYVATYERTMAGTLHINLLVGPWRYIPQAKVEAAWGRRVWLAWVQDSGRVAAETAKAFSPEGLAAYVSKLDQVVQKGRRVSYSKGWPRPPEAKGVAAAWHMPTGPEVSRFKVGFYLGWWREVAAGLWLAPELAPVACSCWLDVVGSGKDPP